MKTQKLLAAALTLAIAACAQTPPPPPPAPMPVQAEAPPPAPVAAEPVMDGAAIAAAQRNLRALGYASGKPGDAADPALQHAVLAFEKDQGLAEDGHLTPALAERLRQMRGALQKATVTETGHSALYVYSDGTTRRQPLELMPPAPNGLVSDAPANFLKPLRPGSQASYRLGHRSPDGGFAPTATVSCHASRIAAAETAFGVADVITVDCAGDGGVHGQSLYSPVLETVVRQQDGKNRRDLIAIRPVTAGWPSAARTGLDWALTHALDSPASNTPIQWSSTAVTARFEIRAFAKVSGQQAGLAGGYPALNCRRFELDQSGAPAARYPGIACQNEHGAWSLPGTNIEFAAPASGLGPKAGAARLRSAQN